MKTYQILALSALLLITPTLQGTCTAGCIDCQKSHCLACHGHKAVGTQCATDPAPASDHCDIYESHVECAWCSQGYAAEVLLKGKCTQGHEIENCVDAFIIGGQKSTLGCAACQGGFPSQDSHSCEAWSTENVQGPEKNCLWGGRSEAGVNCIRCAEGYMNVAGGCILRLIEGCWEANVFKRDCLICDPWLGYQMVTDDGKCTKMSEVKGGNKGGKRKSLSTSISEYMEKYRNYVRNGF